MSKRDKLKKSCAVCGQEMRITMRHNRTYTGGHYFGLIPRYRESELRRVLASGTHDVTFVTHTLAVLNKELKKYDEVEYWECDGCAGVNKVK